MYDAKSPIKFYLFSAAIQFVRITMWKISMSACVSRKKFWSSVHTALSLSIYISLIISLLFVLFVYILCSTRAHVKNINMLFLWQLIWASMHGFERTFILQYYIHKFVCVFVCVCLHRQLKVRRKNLKQFLSWVPKR